MIIIMCIPLGSRRRSGSHWDYHTPVEKITKAEVDEIIARSEYQLFYLPDKATHCQAYAANQEDLHRLLHDGKTRIKVAGSITPTYDNDFRTV